MADEPILELVQLGCQTGSSRYSMENFHPMVATQLHSAADLLKRSSVDKDFELIEGELLPLVPPNYGHGKLQGRIVSRLFTHAEGHDLGDVIGETGFLLSRDPDTVLAPDVAFIGRHRIPEQTSGYVDLAPDLAVEIVSPSNSPGEIERKIAIYLKAGVRQVWVVYSEEREVVIHVPSGPPSVFADQDLIDGGDVLRGLDLPVADIFS